MTESVAIGCEILHSTDDAYLIDDGDSEVWVPKSVVDDIETDNHGKINILYIQEWFALKEGLI